MVVPKQFSIAFSPICRIKNSNDITLCIEHFKSTLKSKKVIPFSVGTNHINQPIFLSLVMQSYHVNPCDSTAFFMSWLQVHAAPIRQAFSRSFLGETGDQHQHFGRLCLKVGANMFPNKEDWCYKDSARKNVYLYALVLVTDCLMSGMWNHLFGKQSTHGFRTCKTDWYCKSGKIGQALHYGNATWAYSSCCM